MLILKKNWISLPDNIHQILIEYYNNAYESKFIIIAESVSASLSDFIITNMVDQFDYVRILAEIFRLVMASQFLKNAYVLAKFIQNDRTSDLFSGQV